MSKLTKKLNRWKFNTPKEIPREEVVAVLKRFFTVEAKGGSHLYCKHEKLIGIEGYGPDGSFQIPIKGGQQVLGFYLKMIVTAIEDIG
ncbi:hypothetical protein DRQ15_04030 [candidate division KSB1 bacterium]|nr:MAG: hypothetical protein DRQ00_08395 [candidate division KSB1 bacterium]RKY91831.1 MAG: hypothetical protein DRQ15_04030 [candidate division KSB1 bacterium]